MPVKKQKIVTPSPTSIVNSDQIFVGFIQIVAQVLNGGVEGNDFIFTADEAVNANATSAANVFTLIGVAKDAVNLGSFTGTLFADDLTLKPILQIVETELEGISATQANIITLTGMAADSVNLGTFTGSTIADNATIKTALQALETKLEEIEGKVDDLIALTGVAANATNLGTFTGSTVTDNSTIKTALQELETEVEIP